MLKNVLENVKQHFKRIFNEIKTIFINFLGKKLNDASQFLYFKVK